MGPSGAGKSTMLDVLALRKKMGPSLAGYAQTEKIANKTMMKKISSYVLQHDCLVEELTVRETLMFAANMQMPGSSTAAERKERVASVIKELGLMHVADSTVGGSRIRGISGGERRRVSIGVQLVSSPQLLFLDEPTSGLDAHTAFEVCFILRRLADAGKTIVCTIHQPSAKLFEAFDNLILLSAGRLVYAGDRSRCKSYFERYGYACKSGWNPADYYLTLVDVVRTSAGTGENDAATPETVPGSKPDKRSGGQRPNDEVLPMTKEEINRMIDNFKNTKEGVATSTGSYGNVCQIFQSNTSQDTDTVEEYARSAGPQFYYLVLRNLKEKMRDPVGFKVQCFQNVFFGLVTGSLYSDLGTTNGPIPFPWSYY